MIKRVLVCLAGTPYTPAAIQNTSAAIRSAIAIAQSNRAEVTGIKVLDRASVRRLAQVRSARTGADDVRGQSLAIIESRIHDSMLALEQACERAKVPYHVVKFCEKDCG